MNRSKPGRFSRVKGPYRVVVQSRELVDNRVYYTCHHPKTNQTWPLCMPLSLGGGGLNVFGHVPLKLPDTPPSDHFLVDPEKAHTAEAFLFFDIYGARYILGCSEREQLEALLDATPTVEEYDTHPKTFGPGDYVLSNGEGETVGRLIIDELGRMTLAASTTLRLQVDAGGKIIGHEDGRVSLPVVVLEPTLEYLNAQTARINANTAQLMRMAPGAIDADIADSATFAADAITQSGLGNAPLAAYYSSEAVRLAERAALSQAWLTEATATGVVPDATEAIASPTMTAPSRT